MSNTQTIRSVFRNVPYSSDISWSEWYSLTSIGFTLFALVEYAFVNYLMRVERFAKARRESGFTEDTANKVRPFHEEGSTDVEGACPGYQRGVTGAFVRSVVDEAATGSSGKFDRCLVAASGRVRITSRQVDLICRWLYPFSYLLHGIIMHATLPSN